MIGLGLTKRRAKPKPQWIDDVLIRTFNAGIWWPTNATFEQDGGTSPLGTPAASVRETTADGVHAIGISGNASALTSYEFSAVVKLLGRASICVNAAIGPGRYGYFDVATGALQATENTSSTFCTDLGNGWRRLGVAFNCVNAESGNLELWLATGAFGSSYIGDTSKGIYIAEVRLRHRIAPYVPT